MTAYRVDMTPGAKQDLIAEARYLAEASRSSDVTLAWVKAMRQAVMELSDQPRSFALARENADFTDEVRQRVYKFHRILFTVHDDLALVLVHRIWHTARDNAGPQELPGVGH